MSETNTRAPDSPGGSPGTPPGASGGGLGERVRDTASTAQEAGSGLAHDVRDRAAGVVDEAASQARRLADQARTELRSEAQSQQQRLAEGLHTIGSEFGRMADASQDPGYATDLVRSAADATNRVAQWLEDREPGSLLADVQDYARRRPGAFIAIAAGAGLLIGRLARGMRDVASDSDARGQESTSGAPGDRSPSGAEAAGGHGMSAAGTSGTTGGAPVETPARTLGETGYLGGGADVDRP